MVEAETAVRARRRLTNKLIAAHDAPRLKPFFDPDAKVIAGDGALIAGAGAIIEAFAGQFAEPGFVRYLRETEAVEVDEAGVRAAERGRWVGEWKGRPGLGGQYLAVWKAVRGQWVIESELYVTLRAGAQE
ncbi:MAG TPA: nuclear transport factor 2 family protein [Caulobacteraceae bacterium]|nr:nuclear transport factor 2 family protein [Caulobacteraceae bacterium]